MCLSDIIATIYGNFLLDYFKLEENYPRLSNYIKSSAYKKHKHFGLIINFIAIIVVLLALICINLKIIFYYF